MDVNWWLDVRGWMTDVEGWLLEEFTAKSQRRKEKK